MDSTNGIHRDRGGYGYDSKMRYSGSIPKLKPGVIIQIHDIFWPNDYPEEWAKRYYNEQYVFGSILLYAPQSAQSAFFLQPPPLSIAISAN